MMCIYVPAAASADCVHEGHGGRDGGIATAARPSEGHARTPVCTTYAFVTAEVKSVYKPSSKKKAAQNVVVVLLLLEGTRFFFIGEK